jgi:hypothetical protein
MAYYVYDRKKAYKKGLDKALLRIFKNEREAEVYVSNDPDSYIVKNGEF